MVKVGDKVAMFSLWNATNIQLESFASLVKESKSLDEAANFCRYVLNSRLCDFLDEHPGTTDLPCDGKTVRRKAEKLLSQVQRRWATRDEHPHVQIAELVQIRAELAALRLKILGTSAPVLNVMEGRADE